MTYLSKIYRYIAFFMAILLFFTSVGAAVDLHFCGGHLKSFSFFEKAKNCYELAGLEQTSCSEPSATSVLHTTCQVSKKDCCTDRAAFLAADHDLPLPVTELTADLLFPAFLAVQPSALFWVSPPLVMRIDRRFAYYHLPFIKRDLSVLYQSYLL